MNKNKVQTTAKNNQNEQQQLLKALNKKRKKMLIKSFKLQPFSLLCEIS